MLNGLWIKNLNEAIIADEYTEICESQKDMVLVVESYEEFVDTINHMYAVVFRLYENFKRDSEYIWVSKEADLEWGNRLIGKQTAFLGNYDGPRRDKLKTEIKQMTHRRLVVKPLWIEMYEHQLTYNGMI